MLNFNVDISDTVAEFSLEKAEVDSLSSYIIDRIVDDFMAKWQDIASNELRSTWDEYKRSMYTERPDEKTAIIGLTSRASRLAMMIETGATAFDEKQGFEQSDKKKMKVGGGWYLTIPFRHGTAEAIMGVIVPGTEVTILDFMKSGATTKQADLPEPYNEIQTHSLALNTGSIITYVHKAPIFEGMHRRDISSTINEKRGGYFTFRRVSDKSDEDAWMHPGFQARNFMDKALAEASLDVTVENAVGDWLDTKFG